MNPQLQKLVDEAITYLFSETETEPTFLAQLEALSPKEKAIFARGFRDDAVNTLLAKYGTGTPEEGTEL